MRTRVDHDLLTRDHARTTLVGRYLQGNGVSSRRRIHVVEGRATGKIQNGGIAEVPVPVDDVARVGMSDGCPVAATIPVVPAGRGVDVKAITRTGARVGRAATTVGTPGPQAAADSAAANAQTARPSCEQPSNFGRRIGYRFGRCIGGG